MDNLRRKMFFFLFFFLIFNETPLFNKINYLSKTPAIGILLFGEIILKCLALLATNIIKDYNFRSKSINSNELLSFCDSSLLWLLLAVCSL